LASDFLPSDAIGAVDEIAWDSRDLEGISISIMGYGAEK
jgi:hypothetical protein